MDSNHIGAVVIGRNEGQRLISCLESLLNCIEYIVYVDSGSLDNSLQEAEKRGVKCVSLDMSEAFTAARARNEGAECLLKEYPKIDYIQFVDGDCELQPNWIDLAQSFLGGNRQFAVVCGRRRERYPGNSIYNQFCDIEWDTPIGDALACGGDALIRVDAFREVGGYRTDLIAGEEPEMCFRMRHKGWKIWRLDAEMTLHDAAMTKVSQWWKRTVRAGYAFALGSSIHGNSEERYWVKENQRIMWWGILLPFSILVLSIFNPIFLGLIFLYIVQIIRVSNKKSDIGNIKFLWAANVVLGKIPEAIGLMKHVKDRFSKTSAQIIEYK